MLVLLVLVLHQRTYKLLVLVVTSAIAQSVERSIDRSIDIRPVYIYRILIYIYSIYGALHHSSDNDSISTEASTRATGIFLLEQRCTTMELCFFFFHDVKTVPSYCIANQSMPSFFCIATIESGVSFLHDEMTIQWSPQDGAILPASHYSLCGGDTQQ